MGSIFNTLTEAFNLVANWVVTVAEQPWCLTVLAVGAVATVATCVIKAQD
jgi:hypothetical protein